MASDFIETRREIAGVRKDLGEQVVGLRRAVVDYHTSVIGHGVIISELEVRLRRVEQHLDLPPLDAHRGTSSADLPRRRGGDSEGTARFTPVARIVRPDQDRAPIGCAGRGW